MSGTTFTTFPVQSHLATQAAPKAGLDQAAAVERSYTAASQRVAVPAAPLNETYAPGPGVTTLAIGEEDGGGATMMPPETGSMSTPSPGGEYQVTTLAIGEEDGGMSAADDRHAMIGGPASPSHGYGAMQPIYSPGEAQYSSFANTSKTTELLNFAPVYQGSATGITAPSATGHAPMPASSQDYGMMQPIYSPGEAEYGAYAKTSETTDLLNFHPVARVPKTITPYTPPPVTAPVSVPAPVAAQPVVMPPMPVGMSPQSVPQSGSFESVGSYEEYVRSVTGTPATPPSVATAQTVPAQPVYESYQPPAASSSYDTLAPSASIAAPAEVSVAAPAEVAVSAPVEATVPVYEAVPLPATDYTAPSTSAEPRAKPEIFEKDTPFDYTGAVDPADPADGNPGYVAPAEVTGTPDTATKADSSYVEVPIDNYWAETTAKAVDSAAKPAPAPVAPETIAPEAATPEVVAPETVAPEPATPEKAETPSSVKLDTLPENGTQNSTSLGGSYVVIDNAIPRSLTGAVSVMDNSSLDAPAVSTPDASGDGLELMTRALGEDAGSP